jgi:hypothetical protein
MRPPRDVLRSAIANFEPGRRVEIDLGSGIAVAGNRRLEAGLRLYGRTPASGAGAKFRGTPGNFTLPVMSHGSVRHQPTGRDGVLCHVGVTTQIQPMSNIHQAVD